MQEQFTLAHKTIWIPGSNGMVASSLIKRLDKENANVIKTTREDVDLTDIDQVENFYEKFLPDLVILAAAKVGGIYANDKYAADFLTTNLKIQTNVIESAKNYNTAKLIFLGSNCSYPKNIPQPIKENCLLSGQLDPANQWYAIAKIAGIKMCQAYNKQYGSNFISLIPPSLYGPKDNFHPKNSHVAASLIRKFHLAKKNSAPSVVVWGTGKPLREFLHVDDLADACVFLAKNYNSQEPINVGSGEEISIYELAIKIKKLVGFTGNIIFDSHYPDGTYQKLLDLSKLTHLGWKSKINLDLGLKSYYDWYLANYEEEHA